MQNDKSLIKKTLTEYSSLPNEIQGLSGVLGIKDPPASDALGRILL